MEYHSTGSPTARLGGSVPNPTDLSRRLLSTQQAQQATESNSDDESINPPAPRSRLNSVTRFDNTSGSSFWETFSPTPRSPVPLQCCCRKETCQNQLAFQRSARSLEDELRLAAEVGQALLQKQQKYELDQKKMENFRSALENQCARSEQSVQELKDIVFELEDTQRALIRERDDALRQKNLLDEKNGILVTALDKHDSMIRDLNTELKERDNEIKRLMASNIKGERSEEREEMLSRQLEDLQQELAVSRKSELAAEMSVKQLKNRFDQLYSEHEKLKKEQIETKKSKQKLEAVAMLRETKENYKSSPSNNEANNHLIALIKELSSANNKLKSENSEYRELLLESRNELSTLQNRIEDMETASTTGYAYPASYASSAAFVSPFKPNFPLHVLDEKGMGTGGENSSNVEVEENGEGSNFPSGSSTKPIHLHMSPISSSFSHASYNTFNSLGVDPSAHSPVGSLVSTSALSIRGSSVFGELEKYLMKKTKHKGVRKSERSGNRKGKKAFFEICEEDEELRKDGAQSDTTEKKYERNYNETSESDIIYSDDSGEERNPEGDEKYSDKPKKESKSKPTKSQGKKKMRAFSLPVQNTSLQKQNVSLLSASLKKSAAENSKDELKGDKSITREPPSGIIKRKSDSKFSYHHATSVPNYSAKRASGGRTIPSPGLKQHKPSQSSPLAVNRRASAATPSSLSVKISQSSNSPAANPKLKNISTKPSIPAFKNPKFATLRPIERKQMMEMWRAGVAKEQLCNVDGGDIYEENDISSKDNSSDVETVKGKSRMDSTNSPIKEFVEEVLVDEANVSAAEAAAFANEVENSLTTSAKSTHSRHASTATRRPSLHVPSIMVQSPNEGKADPHQPESPQQQNPYQILFNIGNSIMDRLKGTDLLALNRRLKRTFDILELSSLSNNLIENILVDVENLRERFRWVEDLRKIEGIKTDGKEGHGGYSSDDNSSQKDLFTFSPENFLPLTHFMQDLLTEVCKLRMMINEVQVEYFQKVEACRRKAEEEFDRSLQSGKEETMEMRERGRHSQSSDDGIGAYFSRVLFGGSKEVQSPPTSARHHSRRLSVDFLHDRDISVGSIDTFAEDSYFADRNLESYTNAPNTLRDSKRRDNNETVGSMLRRNVVSFFGGGGGGNDTILGKKNIAEKKVGKLVDSASGKKKFGTLTGRNVSAEPFHDKRRLTSSENGLISASVNRHGDGNERGLLADVSASSPIRSPTSTTIQYIGSDESPTIPQPISPPPPLTTTTPKQTRLLTNNGNLEDRLRQHLAYAAPTTNTTTIVREATNLCI
ncbi:2550_t:CDS:2 [Funneliformis mosseae]|uniref:2550_t:CDS:1 n=1 Tax=Funneliformis mosseae TaxID=27381 RepID=A0A9N9B5W3_FUNMO|nr:2550_t:CDS:2 [Funneliformis mosseae]